MAGFENVFISGALFEEKMNKQNALLEVMAADKLRELASDWEGLAQLADSGLFGDAFAIGDQFIDTWRDTAAATDYTYPLQLNHIGNVELDDGEILESRPFLQAHYAHPFAVQFSHQRAFVMVAHKVAADIANGTTCFWTRQSDSKYISFKAPEAIAAGQWLTLNNTRIEIYGTNGNLIRSVAATIDAAAVTGTDLGDSPVFAAGDYYFKDSSNGVHSFTLGEALQFGSRLGFWSSKVYPITGDGKTIGTGLTAGSAETGTYLGKQGANNRTASGTYFLNSWNETQYGWNRWKTSAIRQYLNSAAGIGNWWKSQDGFDIAPNELTTKAGFLSGWGEEITAHLKTVKVVTYPNTVQDDTGGNTPDITYDKVFLPSLEEMYISPQKSGEGVYHEYWKRRSGRTEPCAQGGTYTQLITYAVENHTSAQNVRLRSAIRGYAHYAWYVYSSGYVSNNNASYANRFAPLVVL